MKKIVVAFVSIMLLFIAIFCVGGKNNTNPCLRFHVRANSNSSFDQYVKYDVKDKIVRLLGENLENTKNFDEAYAFLCSSTLVLEEYVNLILKNHGCNYKAHVKIGKEYFEERKEDNFEIEEGIYDALIVSLGEGNGNNWWCLVYPSLSFVPVNGKVDYNDIIYKSKLEEIYNKIN